MTDSLAPDEFPPPPHQRTRSGSGSSADDATTNVPGSGSGAANPSGVIPLGPSIEGYTLHEEIHRGGQGIVYRATQLGTKRQVALKVLLEGPYASETTRRRFEREIELAASLRHPSIVNILDSGLSLGRYFFAMEYIDGIRLDRYLVQEHPPLEATLVLLEKVCQAVNFAHQRGVIHRDLKPPNILVDAAGEPHVLDFGLAKPMHRMTPGDSTVAALSTSGQLLGTVAYMSPEQAAGSQDVDVRSDVYSLGVIFYDALVGTPPYQVEGPLGEVLVRIATDEPANPRLMTNRSDSAYRIDDELSTILLKTLEKDPRRRYQTAGDLARDIRHRLNGEPIEAKRASGLYMFRKTLRRYRLQAAMAGLIFLMLIGFLITFAVLFTSERDARRQADAKTEETRVAVERKEQALQDARDATREALVAQDRLKRALARQQIQRGDLALQRSDLLAAQDSYWDALDVVPGPAAIWALRRYYLQTANSETALLAPESHGPTSLSPNAELAAVCSGPDSIWVCEVQTGRGVAWVRTPGQITKLHLGRNRLLAAAGDTWACAWDLDFLCPSVSVTLTAGANIQDLFAADGGQALILVWEDMVQVCRGRAGEQDTSIALSGKAAGSADYLRHAAAPRDDATRASSEPPPIGYVAVPTTAGVELVTLGARRLRHHTVWTRLNEQARAAHFDPGGDDDSEDAARAPAVLCVLANGVYAAPVSDRLLAGPLASQGEWTRLIDASSRWEVFDVNRRLGTVSLATRDGYLAIYTTDGPPATWRIEVDRLVDLRLLREPQANTAELPNAASSPAVVALDERGAITRWLHPERLEQQEGILDAPAIVWATSADGSTVLLADKSGRVVSYPPRGGQNPSTVVKAQLYADISSSEIALAVSGDGSRVLVREKSRLRFEQLLDQTREFEDWSDVNLTTLGAVALSDDGQLGVVLATTDNADRQRVAFRSWPTWQAGGSATRDPAPFDFVGAEVKAIAFVPKTHLLLVARSNGQLFLLDPDEPTRPPAIAPAFGKAVTLAPWMQLDSAPTMVAFNRTGEYLAVACEDGAVRLILRKQREIRQRIGNIHDVSALDFNPRDDVLLVRTADGTIRLCDPVSGETITTWPQPVTAGQPMAAWFGEADTMLLGSDDNVYERRFELADALIERNRPYATQRRIARLLESGDIEGAWQGATELARQAPSLGWATQLSTLEAALRRPAVDVPPEWPATVLAGAPTAVFVRLGHAAYDGERFELAREWLPHALSLGEDTVDVMTLWRIAECAYLFGDYAQAAAGLAAVLRRPDHDPGQAPIITLQRTAALVLDGRLGQAQHAARQIGDPDPWGRPVDGVANACARIVTRLLTAGGSDGPSVAALGEESLTTVALDDMLIRLSNRRPMYMDDGPFFAGELARQRGERAQAAVQYQRCIDLSRDIWPANWARFRLAQLAKEAE